MYKPIKNNDYEKIIIWMAFYRKAYQIIGIITLLLGLSLMPFLSLLIKNNVSDININFIYVIYLLQSVSTYLLFAYKSSLIRAYQKEYVITVISTAVLFVSNISQILILLTFRNIELYIFIVVIFNLIQNLIVSYKSDKMFPWSTSKPEQKLSKLEIRNILKNCYAIFIYKINGVVIKATDNLVLSKFIGLSIVGIYSNYILIYATFQMLISSIFNAMTASLGDLHAEGNIDYERQVFSYLNFIVFWISGLMSVGLFVTINDFIQIWLGPQYVLSQFFVFLLEIEIYIYGIMKTSGSFRTSMGLFQEAKYRPVLCILINLIISIGLVNKYGIYAVLIGTITANTMTYLWVDPTIIYRKVFQKSVKEYFFMQGKYLFAREFCTELY